MTATTQAARDAANTAGRPLLKVEGLCKSFFGVEEDQVGAILGIGERSAVRELLPRPKPTLAELLDELV